jgi:7,8-dihydroneopterin aldolase/epimerase/oxygenase
MKTFLQIKNIECYSYHGCLKEESIIGSRFTVDVQIEDDYTVAMNTDDLAHTADYVRIHDIVRTEMNIPSRLIEHAAGRILNHLSSIYKNAAHISVTVRKFNPPVNGFIGEAAFTVSL